MMPKEDRQLVKNEFFMSWFKDNHINGEKYLYILGVGFDDRMCDGIDRFSNTGIPFDVWEIVYDEGEMSPSKEYGERVRANKDRLENILKRETVCITTKKHIKLWQEDNEGTAREDNLSRFVGEVNASKIVKNARELIDTYSYVIVDISALPQTIYLCLINTLFKCSNHNQRIVIVVNENYSTDMMIEPAQADETAHEMQGFTSPSEALDSVIIWYPMLGEINKPYLNKFWSFLSTPSRGIDEICPVVPFPAENIRRADTILSEYSKILFSDWGIEKKNIIYASETNPLLVCDNLIEVTENYKTALRSLGDCKFVFSAITSKLMTIGMLLAAYDLKSNGYSISLLGISNKGYHIRKNKPTITENKLVCIVV